MIRYIIIPCSQNLWQTAFILRIFLTISRNALSDESDITIWINAERKKDKSVAPYGTNNFGDMKYDHDLTVSSKKKGQDEYSYKFIGIDANTVEYYMGTVTDENPLEKEY